MLRRWMGSLLAAVLGATTLAPAAVADEGLARKLVEARSVYQELLEAPDRAVPKALLGEAKCIAVVPRIFKGAFGVGGRHGRGVLSCKGEGGGWSPPVFVTISGASFGFQAGFQASDLVLFFVSERGVKSLLRSKITLGGDVSVAAGPAGRTAEASTDLKLRAEIYAYAKAKGLFAGISLEGARLAADRKAIRRYYGRPIAPETILYEGEVPGIGPEARAFLEALP